MTEDDDSRGGRIRRRFEALGISDREWHDKTGIARATLNKAMGNYPGTRSSTYTAIEAELDKFEAFKAGRPIAGPVVGSDEPEEVHPGFIRFKVEGVYGAKALVVEGPVENMAELEAAVDRIMRRIAGSQGDGSADTES